MAAESQSPALSGTPVTPPNKRTTRTVDQCEKRPVNRHFVEHKYHDHLHDPITDPAMMDQYNADKYKSMTCSQRGTATLAFPEKLYSMLAASERDGYEDVVTWKPHGRCFIIRKKDVFVNEIMPRFFHQTKLTSFQRQLNLYGFIRLTAGRDRGGYYHEYFIRGRPDLCRFMVRTRVKGNGLKAASSPETEPDFYSMEPCLEKNSVPPSVDRGDSDAASISRGSVSCDSLQKLESADCRISLVQSYAEAYSGLRKRGTTGSFSAYEKPIFDHKGFDVLPRVISPPTLTTSSQVDKQPEQLLVDEIEPDQQCPKEPTSGDVVYFEGLQFHYLDHMELDEVEKIIAEPV